MTVTRIIAVQTIVCAMAMSAPVALMWTIVHVAYLSPLARFALASAAIVPAYVLFALLLTVVSPAATWLTGARTPDGLTLRVADLPRPVLRWAEYVAAIHVVRVCAGTLFRGSPVWSFYLWLNGARVGRGVYVNTLAITDHNLLEFGDNVVIGDNVHLSGHTVEHGYLKTGRVVLEEGVTIGLGSVIGIGVHVGRGTDVGALTLVPKGASLLPDAVYVGIPARLQCNRQKARLHAAR